MPEGKKYEIHLDNFDGPLDLLLHLIDKNKMDIYDIPIAVITEQYLQFLDEAREMDLEIASEFLLIAATLLSIKAKMLLPKRRNADGEVVEEEDPRAELVQRLVEYRFYKETAELLQQKEPKEAMYMLKPQDIDKLTGALDQGNPLEQLELPEEKHELVLSKEEYQVEDSMADIRNRLQQENSIAFTTLFGHHDSKRKVITVFMALLELCRLGELSFQQQENFGPLWIFPKDKRPKN